MAYYRNVREYLVVLESAGKLIRIQQPVNKDTELHPLVRLKGKEEKRGAQRRETRGRRGCSPAGIERIKEKMVLLYQEGL